MSEITSIKGRGAKIKSGNRFAKVSYEDHTDWEYSKQNGYETKLFYESPKEVVNKVDSPDVPLDYSVNPYQGCEHGCVYCYARNFHHYWGFVAGVEFEQNLVVKKNAADLVRKRFNSKSWKGEPIMLSGNTDCYQPIERKFKLTRSILQVCYEFKNPVGLITKNHLILRDIEILKALAEKQLVNTVLSINSCNELLIRKMEPRTSTYKQRLNTVEALAKEGIPVAVLLALIIPGLNATDIPRILKDAASAVAQSAGFIIARLNGDVATVFENWIRKEYPKRADKVLNQIKSMHGGKLNDSRFKTRMRGEGNYAKIIKEQFKIYYQKYFPNPQKVTLNKTLFKNRFTQTQMRFNF